MTLPAGGVVLDAIEVDGARPTVTVDGVEVRAVEPCDAATLTLCADAWSRWSVVDATGGAWFPDRGERSEGGDASLAFLDRLQSHLDEHGRFAEDPDERRRQRADHAEVLERARAFYRGIGPGTLRP